MQAFYYNYAFQPILSLSLINVKDDSLQTQAFKSKCSALAMDTDELPIHIN
jgi:hypothetical protein